MISKRTFKILNIFGWLGFRFGLTPRKWDGKKRRFLPLSKSHYSQFRRMALAIIWTRVALLAYLILTIMFLEVPTYEILVVSGIMVANVSTISIFHLELTTHDKMTMFINGVFLFMEQQMAQRGMTFKSVKKDNSEGLMTMISGSSCLCILLIGPAMLLILNLNWRLAWVVEYLPFPAGKELTAILFTVICAGDWYTHLNVIFIVFVLANNFIAFLDQNLCHSPNPSESTKRSSRLTYTAQYLLYKGADEILKEPLPAFALGGLLIVIAMAYTVIAMAGVLEIWILFAFGVAVTFICVVFEKGGQIGVELTEKSKEYARTFELQANYSRLDQMVFRSLRPMVWHVGSLMDIDQTFFLQFCDVAFNNIISLLVA